MKWIEPKYSKTKVAKAGSHLLHSPLDSGDFEGAIPVLHNWRSAHAFPMQIMLDLLRAIDRVRVIDTDAHADRFKNLSPGNLIEKW